MTPASSFPSRSWTLQQVRKVEVNKLIIEQIYIRKTDTDTPIFKMKKPCKVYTETMQMKKYFKKN